MAKLILIDAYWNELDRINLPSYPGRDNQYIYAGVSSIDYTFEPGEYLLLEDEELERISDKWTIARFNSPTDLRDTEDSP